MTAPLVSAVIPAYNYAGYVGASIDSVLAQTYPQEAIEIVVVDDGSTDATADVVRGYGDRVRYVHKQNGGLISAVDRGLAEARGELIALLDADDVWPAGKLRRQVDVLLERPEVGLVYGDMEVIDGADAPTHPSFFAMYGLTPARGRAVAALMTRNVVTQASMVFRASLRASYHPIARGAAYPDWWIAVQVARVAEIEWIPDCTCRYRMHQANMGFGAGEERVLVALREHEIPFRRWLLADLQPGEVAPADLVRASGIAQAQIAKVAQATGIPAAEVAPPDGTAAAERAAAAIAALSEDAPELAVAHAAAALALDPFDRAARTLLERSWALCRAAAVHPLQSARGFVTLAFADELVADPALLAAYGRHFGAADDATLVIYAPGRSEEQALAELMPALGAAGIDPDSGPDLLLHPGEGGDADRAAIWPRLDALLTEEGDERFRGVAAYDARAVDRLRARAAA